MFAQHSFSQDDAAFYCGRRLANAIATVCWTEEVKRDAGWWRPLATSEVHALSVTRGKRGPVDECCNKACTIDELRTYC